MKIANIQKSNTEVTFQKGLTSFEINKVKNMSPYAYEHIAEELSCNYGISAYFAGCNAVAWCTKEVVKIMQKAGFKLPSKVSFEPIQEADTLGMYNPSSNSVYINSNIHAFKDLESLNQLEEAQGHFHPSTKHFLNTYLHEFSHAAHFSNLFDKFNGQELYEKMSFLHNNSASAIVREPLKTSLEMVALPIGYASLIDICIPPQNGEYAAKNLNEYFAEKNARILAEHLGKNFDTSNITSELSNKPTHPKGWNFKNELLKIIKAKLFFSIFDPMSISKKTISLIAKFAEELNYIDGDIFNGNIDYLKKL